MNGGIRCICSSGHPVAANREFGSGPRSVAFVFRNNVRHWGSILARSYQLADLLQEFDPAIEVDVVPFERYLGGSDIIVASKSITKSKSVVKRLRRMKRQGSRIVFDLVDGNPRSTRRIDSLLKTRSQSYIMWTEG